jgi:hypothetical protein
VNDAVSRSFARLHGRRIIWRTPLTGKPTCFLTEANRYPGLTCLFVSGAPALLTSNTNPDLGWANGTIVLMHSLSLDDREDHTRISRLLKQSGQTDIFLTYQPKYIWTNTVSHWAGI